VLTEVIVSDTHVGSAYGVFPQGFRKSTGEIVRLNKGQRYLGKCWQHVLGVLPPTFDILVLNGDLTDGQNPRQMARDLTEADPEWQGRAAYELLAPLAERAGVVYATMGTTYHTGEAGTFEEQLAERLGAVPDEWGHCARDWLGLSVEGIKQDIAHAQSSMLRYKSTAAEREIQFEALAAVMKEGGTSHIIIRSHVHTYFNLFIEGTLYVSTFSFQLDSRYARLLKVKNRYLQRHIGVTVLELYPERVGKELHVAEIKPIYFKHPKWRREKYERKA